MFSRLSAAERENDRLRRNKALPRQKEGNIIGSILGRLVNREQKEDNQDYHKEE